MSVCENVNEFVSQATLRLGMDAVQQEGVTHKYTPFTSMFHWQVSALCLSIMF